MKPFALAVAGCALVFALPLRAQSPDAERLDAMSKKLDEVNAKLDTLSQELLKLEQQTSNARPGVMIGEPTPPPTAPAQSQQPAAVASNGSSHTIAKGETLTAIAKMHKVSVDELQKANHIENDRKLQVGQTLIIPTPSASPATSAAPNTP